MPSYKDAKTNKWYCQFYFEDHTGNRKKKLKRGFELKRDADEWERNFLEHQQGSPDMVFSSLCEDYLADVNARLKPRSYHTKESRCRLWIIPYFEKRPVNDISTADIRKWQIWLKEQTTEKGSKLSDGYMENLYRELFSIFGYAVTFKNLPKSPCGDTKKVKFVGKKNKSLKFWTREQFQQFISTFRDNDPHRTAYLMLYYTGMRLGELEALTIADVDTTIGAVHITKSLQIEKGKRTVTTTKTGKDRDVSIPPFLCQEIDRYKTMLFEPRLSDRLFSISRSSYGAVLKSHADKAELPQIRVHDLRHSHASLLINNNVNVLQIAEQLGHTDPTITLRVYAHLFKEKKNDIADLLQRMYEADN